MPGVDRTFRLFVSSTFSDFKNERDALHREVFPKLRQLCASHNFRFQPIDLRWGVRYEAALDHRTLDICLEEVRRCATTSPPPNLLILLGDRYGWCPPPRQIPADEFLVLLSHMSAADRALIEWRMSVEGSETGWYRRDDNAWPPAYVLQPRSLPTEGDKAPTMEALDKEALHWSAAEREIRAAFSR